VDRGRDTKKAKMTDETSGMTMTGTMAVCAARDYVRAMKLAEVAIQSMLRLAKDLDYFRSMNSQETAALLDKAGFSEVDYRSLARLLEESRRLHREDEMTEAERQESRWAVIATGCLHIGSMANARRSTK
jgi:ribosomal silencing factor RsfS